MSWGDVAKGAALGAGVSTAATLALLRRYLRDELKPPQLVHAPMEERESAEDQRLLQEVKLLLRDYWPHPVLDFSGYISTAWSGLWAAMPSSSAAGRIEPLILQDGGTVSLHWGDMPFSGCNRIVLLLPGLNNDSRTSFVQSTMAHLRRDGFCAVALNYRGVGGLPLTSPKFGCADSWQDLNEVVQHIEAAMPGAELFAMGYSMGAGMLLRYLGEEGARVRIKAAVAIAAPADFPAVGASLESSLKKRGMNFLMVNGVKLFMLKALHSADFKHRLDMKRVWGALTLRQLEEATICPLHGYTDGVDYYSKNSPRTKLHQIAVPTLVVNAEDDPVVSVSTLPLDDMRLNPRLYVVITRRGGHIGWGSGGLGAAAWTDSMASHFMEACAPRSRM